jgi:octaprenyl-diphosphate synthase
VALVVDLEGERQKKPNLDKLQALVADDLKAVNEVIVQRMESPVALIPQLAGHLVASGGKRLRPILTLASARMCGYQGNRHIPLAACVEFIHTATLLHDDVLVGDFLFSRAFQVMVADGAIKVLKILSDASAVIAEGEVMQLMTTGDTATGEANYLEVITAKTAELFAAACRIGAVVAERPKAEEDALLSYGTNLGIAFQLIDDVLDYSAKQAELGKTVGDDFREGKISLPTILAFNRGNEAERTFWRRTLEDMDQTDDDLAHAITLMTKHHALSDTVDRARHYGAVARDALGIFPDNAQKQALLELVDFCIERAY